MGRLYDADEDWRAADEDVDLDNFATSRPEDEKDEKDKDETKNDDE